MATDPVSPKSPKALTADTPAETSSTTSQNSNAIHRRDFFKATTTGAGLLALAACASDEEIVPGLHPRPTVNAITGSRSDVIVVGAGLWGTFTAYNLRRRGATVTLVDQFGAGNSRATSGDETRGVRSTYGERGETGELWMLWAREAMKRWQDLDEEWAHVHGTKLYHKTGDLTFRATEGSGIIKTTREWWDKYGITYEMPKPEVIRKEYPVYGIDDIVEILYEPEAGVVRSRKACQAMATVFERIGGHVVISKAKLGAVTGGKLDGVVLENGDVLRADLYVFALGPWHRTFFPELLGNRMRTPLGTACYFGIPAGDSRFTFPNMPSYNFPGTTGWPTLPVDSRGFRVRGGLGGGGGRGGGGGAGAGRGAAGAAAPGGRGAVTGPDVRAGAGAGRGAAATTARGGGGGGGGGGGRGGRGGRGGAAGGRGGGGGGGAGGGTPPDPNAQNPDLSSRWADSGRIDSARNFLVVRFPRLATMPILETRSCHYEGTSSRDFLIDKHPDMSNVWLAGGGNSEGAKFAPVVGDYISQRVVGIEGDPEVAKRFRIPETTYDPPPAADSTQGRGGAARGDSGGRGGDNDSFDDDFDDEFGG